MILAISLTIVISATFQSLILYFVVKMYYQVIGIDNKISAHQLALIKQQNEICNLLNTANSYLSRIAGAKNTNPKRGITGRPPKIKKDFDHKFV